MSLDKRIDDIFRLIHLGLDDWSISQEVGCTQQLVAKLRENSSVNTEENNVVKPGLLQESNG